jgi:hypothetical protein
MGTENLLSTRRFVWPISLNMRIEPIEEKAFWESFFEAKHNEKLAVR